MDIIGPTNVYLIPYPKEHVRHAEQVFRVTMIFKHLIISNIRS